MVARRLIQEALASEPDIQVVSTAANGAEAVQMFGESTVDVVLLDIEMPVMDGLMALREIRKRDRQIPVILFSSLTERGASTTLEGLALGANDYCPKPTSEVGGREVVEIIRKELAPRMRAHVETARRRSAWARPARATRPDAESRPPAPNAQEPAARAKPTARPPATQHAPAPTRPNVPRSVGPARVAVIGISTGGPQALAQVLPALPTDFALPLLIVQHIPEAFSRSLAERLNTRAALDVHVAQEGEPLRRGVVLVAPGGSHLEVVSRGTGLFAHLSKGALVHSCRPSVDVTLDSVYESCSGAAVVAIMTGMGRDGADGCASLRRRGAHVIAQDEESSAVWGMPGAVVREGSADSVVPLSEIAAALTSAARRSVGPSRYAV